MVHLLLALAISSSGNGLPVKAPADVGMSAARLKTVDRVVEHAIRAGGFPGAAVVIGRNGAAVWQRGYGRLDWSSQSPRVSPTESIYDLASLTKVIGTTTAMMVLFDQGRVKLDEPVATYLPAFGGGVKDRVTVRMLLTHHSGLPADRDLWRLAHNPTEARRIVLETPLVNTPGQRYVYSDLGAILLGMIVESVSGMPLDQFLQQNVFQPLGMTNTFFRPADSLHYRVAPTEVAPPRGYPLQGEVHDENAYALGGVAGHAGLFSTAADLAVFAQMMLNGGEYNGVRVVADSTVTLFTTQQVGNRALGWATADGTWGSGDYLSPAAFGHVGYTGTSIWIDPDQDMFVIVLTNRVHSARVRRPAKVIADIRSDVSDAAALAVIENPDHILDMPRSFRADLAKGWNPPRHTRRRTTRRRTIHHKASTRHSSHTPAKKKSSGSHVAKKSTAKAAVSKGAAKK